jgi:anion-transporting  ArsA/GET3 family ATPase
MSPASPSIPQLLKDKQVCICAGPGGVGKTTTSAAIALGMAARGLKVVVVTIDPARRLADALGLEQLDNEPRLVSTDRLTGVEMAGELWAMMLDPKRTFDELIDRVAPSPDRAEEIKRNGIYRELSTAVSGSQEFTAIEKLYELVGGDYDLIVLDTPPSHSAIEFLNAPGRLIAFLGGGALQAFLKPTGFGMRLLGLGATPMLGALRALTGVDLITDLTGFFVLLGGMTDEFKDRAKRVQELLQAPETAFLLITSAQAGPTAETLSFARTLAQGEMALVGAVVNRVHAALPEGAGGRDRIPAMDLPAMDLPADLLEKLTETIGEQTVLAERDAANLAHLRSALAEKPVLEVPELDDEIHDLEGLLQVREHLFGPGQLQRPQLTDGRGA